MSTSPLKLRITEDMKAAMRAQEKQRLGAIRLILAAIKQVEVDERIDPDDQRVLGILSKMLKQRQDSLTQYQTAQRHDLAAQEEFEIKLIQEYMPTPLTEQELDSLLDRAIAEAGAKSAQDMGKVMALLKPQLQGRADAGHVSQKVKQRLSSL
jgi:uncharacterized protein YqeY